MANITPFLLNGIPYNVRVQKLVRKFSVQDTNKSGRTQSGSMYRDIIGTFYNYEMVIEMRGNDREALDAIWEAISQPKKSHVCVFPYGQKMLTQNMYVTSGEQELLELAETGAYWGEITISFIAMTPKVRP